MIVATNFPTGVGGTANLFVAGIVPGLMMAGVMWSVIWFQARGGRLPRSSIKIEKGEMGTLIRDELVVLGLHGVIVGCTLSGVFTATEAGGMAVVYALIVA